MRFSWEDQCPQGQVYLRHLNNTTLWTDEYMTEYVKQLTDIPRKFHLLVSDRLLKPSEILSNLSNVVIMCYCGDISWP